MKKSVGTLIATGGLTLFLAWGCGDEVAPKPEAQPTSTGAEATVTGKVTVKGKAVAAGKVTFEPPFVNGKLVPERITDIGKDGNYSITTYVGKNSVIVSNTGRPEAESGSYNKKSVDVGPGTNTIDLNLPFAQ